MQQSKEARAQLHGMQANLVGQVVLPGDEGWDHARQAFNLLIDLQPVAVVFPESTDDVVEVINFARGNGLRVAPQGTGHGAGPLPSLENTILLRTKRMNRVEIDERGRRARVEPGARWGQVTAPASEMGLAALAGTSPTVGVVGYTLGGGVGWLSRLHGLAANKATAIEIVNAGGEPIRADAQTETELFWALRGGGGSFGIVTALEFDLFSVPRLFAGALLWPWEQSTNVLSAWREWIATVPDEVTSIARIAQFPPLPDIPESRRGRKFAIIEAAFIGDEMQGAEVVRPLRELGPEIDTFAMISPAELGRLHMDPPHPVPAALGHMLLRDLPPEGIEALVTSAGPESGSQLASVELRHLGGALGRSEQNHGALSSLNGTFLWNAMAHAPSPEMMAAADLQISKVRAAISAWDAGHALNFTQQDVDPRRFFADGVYPRRQNVRAHMDPDDLFVAAHQIHDRE